MCQGEGGIVWRTSLPVTASTRREGSPSGPASSPRWWALEAASTLRPDLGFPVGRRPTRPSLHRHLRLLPGRTGSLRTGKLRVRETLGAFHRRRNLWGASCVLGGTAPELGRAGCSGWTRGRCTCCRGGAGAGICFPGRMMLAAPGGQANGTERVSHLRRQRPHGCEALPAPAKLLDTGPQAAPASRLLPPDAALHGGRRGVCSRWGFGFGVPSLVPTQAHLSVRRWHFQGPHCFREDVPQSWRSLQRACGPGGGAMPGATDRRGCPEAMLKGGRLTPGEPGGERDSRSRGLGAWGCELASPLVHTLALQLSLLKNRMGIMTLQPRRRIILIILLSLT